MVKLLTQTTGKYLWLTKLIGPVHMSVSENNGDWVKLFSGFRIGRLMFVWLEVK